MTTYCCASTAKEGPSASVAASPTAWLQSVAAIRTPLKDERVLSIRWLSLDVVRRATALLRSAAARNARLFTLSPGGFDCKQDCGSGMLGDKRVDHQRHARHDALCSPLMRRTCRESSGRCGPERSLALDQRPAERTALYGPERCRGRPEGHPAGGQHAPSAHNQQSWRFLVLWRGKMPWPSW